MGRREKRVGRREKRVGRREAPVLEARGHVLDQVLVVELPNGGIEMVRQRRLAAE